MMQLKSDVTDLKEYARNKIEKCELGILLLKTCGDLKINVCKEEKHGTHFFRGKLNINLKKEADRNNEDEVASTLIHELIHAKHWHENSNDFRLRNTTSSKDTSFPNQEEELTITGKVDGKEVEKYYYENIARKQLKLVARTDAN